jgi:hypothetical protein
MRTRLTLLFFAGLMVNALTANAQLTKNDPLANALTGEWFNRYIRIDIVGPAGEKKTVEADSTNWEQRLGIKPIHTFFQQDGSYYSEYRNLDDSLVRKTAGQWTITTGDTLVMWEKQPEQQTLKLKLKIVDRTATFSGLIDFDGQGVANDVYYGIQQKKATNL